MPAKQACWRIVKRKLELLLVEFQSVLLQKRCQSCSPSENLLFQDHIPAKLRNIRCKGWKGSNREGWVDWRWDLLLQGQKTGRLSYCFTLNSNKLLWFTEGLLRPPLEGPENKQCVSLLNETCQWELSNLLLGPSPAELRCGVKLWSRYEFDYTASGP